LLISFDFALNVNMKRKGTIVIKEKGQEKNIEKNVTKVNKIYLVREKNVIDLGTVKVRGRMLIKILKLNHLKSTVVEINQVKEIERN